MDEDIPAFFYSCSMVDQASIVTHLSLNMPFFFPLAPVFVWLPLLQMHRSEVWNPETMLVPSNDSLKGNHQLDGLWGSFPHDLLRTGKLPERDQLLEPFLKIDQKAHQSFLLFSSVGLSPSDTSEGFFISGCCLPLFEEDPRSQHFQIEE